MTYLQLFWHEFLQNTLCTGTCGQTGMTKLQAVIQNQDEPENPTRKIKTSQYHIMISTKDRIRFSEKSKMMKITAWVKNHERKDHLTMNNKTMTVDIVNISSFY